jgi:hypothetical protein
MTVSKRSTYTRRRRSRSRSVSKKRLARGSRRSRSRRSRSRRSRSRRSRSRRSRRSYAGVSSAQTYGAPSYGASSAQTYGAPSYGASSAQTGAPVIPCNSFASKSMCENSHDSAGYRRCRYNYGSRACEDLPEKYRVSATMQVGAANPYEKYVAGARKPLPTYRQPEQPAYARTYVPGPAKSVKVPENIQNMISTPKSVNPLMLSGAVQRLRALGKKTAPPPTPQELAEWQFYTRRR